MATAISTPCLTVEQYLKTTYRPDVDFVDDHIEERNVGEFDHNTVQYRVARFFDDHRHEWKIRFAIEQRIQTSERRFRIPDVCVMDASGPKEQIVRQTPLLCVEVLSPEDTLNRMLVRAQDYFSMGIPAVWILDPARRTAWVCSREGMDEYQSGIITLPGSPISLKLYQIFSALDED